MVVWKLLSLCLHWVCLSNAEEGGVENSEDVLQICFSPAASCSLEGVAETSPLERHLKFV